MESPREERFPCGVQGCGVWFTSEEVRDAHHAKVHDPKDVEAARAAALESQNQTPDQPDAVPT